jgi:methylglutaconyl-CoA hydratase
MADALTVELVAAAEDPSVRAVVLAGAGRNFSAGADLTALEQIAAGGDESSARRDTEKLRRLFEVLVGHPKLTVAAVHGAAVAGGCGLATACDFVVAEPAARFAYPEVRIGFVAALVMTFLTRRVPGHVARRLLLDPEIVSGERAVALGLADELVAEGESLNRALALARTVCAKASPAALAQTKALFNEVSGLDWRAGFEAAEEVNVRQRMHPECARGVRTFLETKSTPNWLDTSEESSSGS